MLTLSPAVRIYLATGATDLRRSIDGLSALVRERFTLRSSVRPSVSVSQSPRRPDSRSSRGISSGFWVLYKRLEQGHVCVADRRAATARVEMRSPDLVAAALGRRCGADAAASLVRTRRVTRRRGKRRSRADRIMRRDGRRAPRDPRPRRSRDRPRADRARCRTSSRGSQRENASLRHQLDVLCQRLFGKKSETRRSAPVAARVRAARERTWRRLPADRDGLGRDAGARPSAPSPDGPPAAPRASAAPPRRDRRARGRQAVCRAVTRKTRIGESVSEKLEYEPASFVVIETVRAKYACPHCHERRRRSASAAAGDREVARRRRVAGPRRRLEIRRSSRRCIGSKGSSPARASTCPAPRLCGWVADVATALAPIGDQLRREVTAATYLQTDDTTVTVLDDQRRQFQRTPLDRTWIRSAGRSCSTRRATHERDGPDGVPRRVPRRRSRPTRMRGTTRCIAGPRRRESAAGRMRAADSSKPSLIDRSAALIVALDPTALSGRARRRRSDAGRPPCPRTEWTSSSSGAPQPKRPCSSSTYPSRDMSIE